MSQVLNVVVGPSSGSQGTAEVVDFSSLSWTSNKDDGCDLTFSLDGRSQAGLVISELDTDCWLYSAGALAQRFRIMSVEQTWGPDGTDDISIAAVCYRRILYRRLLVSDLTYSAVGQGDIAWGLVADTQAQTGGDLGITAGTLTNTTTRDRGYLAGVNVGEMLTNLANVIDGPRYTLGADRVLNVLAGDTWPTQAQPIVLGATATALARKSGAALFANAVRGTADQELTTPVVVEDAGLASDPRGRWDTAVSWPTVTEQATLDENTNGELLGRVSPVASWSVAVDPQRWLTDLPIEAGDLATLVVPRSTVAVIGVPAATVNVQTQERSVTVTPDGDLAVSVSVIELPPE